MTSIAVLARRSGRRSQNIVVDTNPAELVWIDGPPTLNAIGATANSRAVVRNAEHQALAALTPTYTSLATGVATVNSSGVVTAVSNGTATIQASYAGLTSITQTATVTQLVSQITGVASTLPTDDASNGTFSPVGKDANNNTVSGATFAYSSSNPSVITVDASGNWAGQSAGTATITITPSPRVSGYTYTVSVTVTAVTFTISASPSPLYIGNSFTLTATLNGSGVTADNYTTSDTSKAVVDPPTLTGAPSPSSITQGTGPITVTFPCTNPRATQTLGGLPSGVTAGSATVVDSTHISFPLTATGSATTGGASVYLVDSTHGNSGTQTLTVASASGIGTLPVTSGLVLRLHANAGVATSGSNVTTWTDQSSTGAVFTATGTPSLVANAYNAKPCVRLASGQYLVAGGVVTAFNTTDYTTFVVCKPASLSASRQWPWSNEDATAKTGESVGFDNFPRYTCAHGDGTTRWQNLECTSTPSTTVLHTVALRETSGSPTKQKLYADNANGAGDATNHAANTTKPPAIGCLASALGTEAFTGDICEIIRFSRGLSDAELTSMETYFQTEWGTP